MTWRPNDLTALANAPIAAAGCPIHGYQTAFNDQQHVNFMDASGHVHELWFGSEWAHNDLSELAGAPPGTSPGRLDGYVTIHNDQQHLDYLDAHGHVHELLYANQRTSNDLTSLAAAPPAIPTSSISGYETGFNSQQHVNYLDGEGQVHELWLGSKWAHNDLTTLAAAPAAVSGSPIHSYATAFNGQQHVNYLDGNGHVHELWLGSKWAHNDLTILAGAPAAVSGSPLYSYVTTFNNQQHVNYLDHDGHVHELWYGNEWAHNDLTILADAPPAAAGRKIVGYETTYNNQQHVIYLDGEGHVHELWYGNEWAHNDLTILAGAPPASGDSRVIGYQTTFNNQQHIDYLDGNGHVHELFG